MTDIEKLKVTVAVSYNTVASTEDPFLVIEIMRLIAEHNAANPVVEPEIIEELTVEQALIRERDAAVSDAETYRIMAQEKQAKIDSMTSIEEVSS